MGTLAIVSGIIAIIAGLASPWFYGWTGIIFTGVIGVLAVVFTILRNRKAAELGERKKIAGIVLGFTGVLLGLMCMSMLSSIASSVRSNINKYGISEFPILDKTIDKLGTGGIFGWYNAVSDNGYTDEALTRELDKLNAYQKGN